MVLQCSVRKMRKSLAAAPCEAVASGEKKKKKKVRGQQLLEFDCYFLSQHTAGQILSRWSWFLQLINHSEVADACMHLQRI